jgi:hypothetical protein
MDFTQPNLGYSGSTSHGYYFGKQ